MLKDGQRTQDFTDATVICQDVFRGVWISRVRLQFMSEALTRTHAMSICMYMILQRHAYTMIHDCTQTNAALAQ